MNWLGGGLINFQVEYELESLELRWVWRLKIVWLDTLSGLID